MQEVNCVDTVKVVDKLNSASAKESVAPLSSADPTIERELQFIRSPEFTERLTAAFHNAKLQVLAERNS